MSRPAVVLVSGRRNCGKSAYLQAMVARARRSGRSVAGVINHGILFDTPGADGKAAAVDAGAGEKYGLELEIIATGRRLPLARPAIEGGEGLLCGRYLMRPDTLETAAQALRDSLAADVVVVDEYGPLERRDLGLWSGLAALLQHHTGVLFISVRPRYLTELQQRIRAADLPADGGAPLPSDRGVTAIVRPSHPEEETT